MNDWLGYKSYDLEQIKYFQLICKKKEEKINERNAGLERDIQRQI